MLVVFQFRQCVYVGGLCTSPLIGLSPYTLFQQNNNNDNMHLKIIRVSLRDLGEMSAECLLEMYACLALINQFPKAVIFSSAF